MSKMTFGDILIEKDGLIKGPFGGDIKKSLFVPKSENTYKVYEQGVVLNKNINYGNYYLPQEYVEEKLFRFKVKAGDILLTGAGTLGELFLVPSDFPEGVINQALLRIRLKDDVIDKDFFRYFFKYYIKSIISRINGDSVIPNLPPLPIIKSTKIDLPNIIIQKQISKLLTHIDTKIDLNNKINNELESVAKLLYDYWFVQFDFPDENGKPYKSSGGRMVLDKVLKREIPEGWKVKTLEELGVFKNGINYNSDTIGDTKAKIINVRDISNTSWFIKTDELDELYLHNKEIDKYRISQHDILIARSGIPGAIRMVSSYTYNTIFCGFIIRYFVTNLNYKPFMFFILKDLESSTNSKSAGTIMKNVNQDTLKRFSLALPQDEIISAFNLLIKPIFAKINISNQENQDLIELRDWLLPMLMNGQVKITS